MRTLASAGTLTAAVAAAILLAPAAHATAPGDNGTVKIHDAKTGEELRKNEPHVCTFYLDAFGFDSTQKVDWHIEAWAPTAHVKGETVKSGSLTLDAEGHGRTPDQSLPDGHYKLFWNFDGEHGRAKHKVFWTDCGEGKPGGEKPGGGKPGGGKPTPSASESTPANPSSSPSSPSGPAQPTEAPTASTPAGTGSTPPASAAPAAASSSPSAHDEGNLAETGTGAPVGLLSAAAAALVAAGAFLAIRRRKAQQQH
ncbi:LPXTG cell wall anchor domain-containing protein [Streptomyces sp. NBC_00378]|uniref:LPXTG cell wall anchor domain-containing protein n=1 Tax=Streptomyces sp. NBC_00378 TaxID=2975732 RepID=UPI002254EECA|nr:LPXTG cell wall anchor domain-containing protein [Streptomyces sp. NBC_00378]MCX5111730.1 LPXTG cell wall anchor domain-containing protein [Streptomyces sp. NBC_00378]